MEGLRRHLLKNRTLAAMVVAAALLLRALVPAGYMVAPAQETRQVFVTICTGLEGKAERIALPVGTGHGESGKEHQAKDSPCAFTALAGLADLPVLAELPVPAASASVGAARPVEAAVGRGLAAPPPPQTGPPITA